MIQLEYPTEVDGGGGDAERRLGRRDADQTVALVARQRFGRRRGAPARHRLDRRVHQAHDADFDVGVGVGQRSTHLVLAAGADVRQPQELQKKTIDGPSSSFCWPLRVGIGYFGLVSEIALSQLLR